MAGWETDATLAARSELMRDFAEIWQAAEKIVILKGTRDGVDQAGADSARLRS